MTEFGLTPDNVERVVARLKQRGLIGEVRGDINGYIPARPAATIRLEEVLAAFRSSDIEIAHGATSPALRQAGRRAGGGAAAAHRGRDDRRPDAAARTRRAAMMSPRRKPQVVRPDNRRRVRFRQRGQTASGGGDVLSAVAGRGGGRGGRAGRGRRRAGAGDRGRVAARGLAYSGALAGKLFAGVAVPERVLVIAPNHTGHGPRASVWSARRRRGRELALPGLDVPIDARVRRVAAGGGAAALRADRDAHEDEHAIEVLLPLIAVRQPKLRLAAIVLGGLGFARVRGARRRRSRARSRPRRRPDADRRVVGHEPLPGGRRGARDRSSWRWRRWPRADPRGLYDAVRAHGITHVRLHPGDRRADRGARAGRHARHRRRLRHQRRRRRRSRPRRRLRRRPHRRVDASICDARSLEPRSAVPSPRGAGRGLGRGVRRSARRRAVRAGLP